MFDSSAVTVTNSFNISWLGSACVISITPSASYKGKTVKYSVSISGAQDAILYARGDIG